MVFIAVQKLSGPLPPPQCFRDPYRKDIEKMLIAKINKAMDLFPSRPN